MAFSSNPCRFRLSALVAGLALSGATVASAQEGEANTAPVLTDPAPLVGSTESGSSLIVPLPQPSARASDPEGDALGWAFATAPSEQALETSGGGARLTNSGSSWSLSFFTADGFTGEVPVELRAVETNTAESLVSEATLTVTIRVGATGPMAAGPGDGPQLAPGDGPGAGPGDGPPAAPGDGPQSAPGDGPDAGPGSGPGDGPDAGPGAEPGDGPGALPDAGPSDGAGPGPGAEPGDGPGAVPDAGPSDGPGAGPSPDPSAEPGDGPGAVPNAEPSDGPGAGPGPGPSAEPGDGPGAVPDAGPSDGPGAGPGPGPSAEPGDGPGAVPDAGPSDGPGAGPSPGPGAEPGDGPGAVPDAGPSDSPGAGPSPGPSAEPGDGPGAVPDAGPSDGPGAGPSPGPGAEPGDGPGAVPDAGPSDGPGGGPGDEPGTESGDDGGPIIMGPDEDGEGQPDDMASPLEPNDGPAGLRLVAASAEAIVLAWEASADAVYTISRDGVIIGSVEGSRFVDDAVVDGQQYTYEITLDGGSIGGSSIVVTAVRESLGADRISPRAPGEALAFRTVSGEVIVAWASGGDDRSTAGYDLYRDGRYLVTVYATAYIDTNSPDERGTHYEVVAFDESRNYSPRSVATLIRGDLPAITGERSSIDVTGDGTRFSFAPVNRSGSVTLLVGDDAATALWPSAMVPGAEAIDFATSDASLDVYVLPAWGRDGEVVGLGIDLITGTGPSGTLLFEPSSMGTIEQ